MKSPIKYTGFPDSDLTVSEFIKLSREPFFKIGITERASQLGNISYQGFKYVFHRNNKKQFIVFVNMYFYVTGQKHQNKREKYLLVVKFPYYRGIKNLKRLYDVPIQIFSSDPSFKFYFTYVLHKHKAVLLDEPEFKQHLGIALTKPPNIRNPLWKIQLTKHFYKLFQFLSNAKPSQYLKEGRWQIPSKQRVTIKNTNASTRTTGTYKKKAKNRINKNAAKINRKNKKLSSRNNRRK